jgi:hypothetical protein
MTARIRNGFVVVGSAGVATEGRHRNRFRDATISARAERDTALHRYPVSVWLPTPTKKSGSKVINSATIPTLVAHAQIV